MKRFFGILLSLSILVGFIPSIVVYAGDDVMTRFSNYSSVYKQSGASVYATSACEHTTGEWTVTTEPYAFLPGVKSRICTQCGETVETAAVYNTFGLGEEGNVDKLITGVFSEVTPDALTAHFRNAGYEVTVVGANGEETELVGTGSKVICDGEEYQVVIRGEVTGDGVIDIFDLTGLLSFVNGNDSLDGVYKKAGLVSNVEEVDIFDLTKLLGHVSGDASIEPPTPPSSDTNSPETDPPETELVTEPETEPVTEPETEPVTEPVTEPPETECTSHTYVLESNTGSCTVDGVKTYVCSTCGDSYTEAVTATGHAWDNGTVTTPAACGQTGVKTYTCKNGCGATKTSTIAAKNHIWSVATVTTPPTCTENGVKSYYCLYNCGATKTTNIAALGHDYENHICQREGCGYESVLYASAYGVVGDGVTDDGPAISRAVNAAKTAQARLIFDANKTYYIGSSTNADGAFVSPFIFTDATMVTVEGNGSTFLCAPSITYFVISNSSDIVIKNCNFDQAIPVYLVGTVTAVNGKTVTFTTDLEPYMDSYDYSNITAFSIEKKISGGLQQRSHKFITSMVKTASKTVEVTYTTSSPSYAVGDVAYLPNPGVGHVGSEAIYIGHNTGTITVENMEVRAAKIFVFSVKGNDGDVYFNNVDLVTGADNNRALKLVAWRDGYHCKDNRGKLHWTDCEAGILFDDVFNVSNTLGCFESVSSATQFACQNYEYKVNGRDVAFDCIAGDILDFYDQDTGKYHGYATVQSVTVSGNTSIVTLSTTDCTVDLTQVSLETCRIANRNTCGAGSTITDSSFEGTYRFRAPMTIRNTEFRILTMWIMTEGGVEGLIPRDIHFYNCTFRYGYIQIDARNRELSGKPYWSDIAAQIRGIRAYDCTFANGCYIKTNTGCYMETYTNGVLQMTTEALRPSGYVTRTDYKTLTAAQLSAGH
ncbi:MAG: hypothetical protein IJD10_04300, partial [Clostridia bacterium]|nr:hypothetical protein [Clostridia bacterium]